MDRRINSVDHIDHEGHVNCAGQVQSWPIIICDELSFCIQRQRVIAFRNSGVVELSQQSGHYAGLRATYEEVYEEIRFDTNCYDQHFQQETNVAAISVFEFLALLPEE